MTGARGPVPARRRGAALRLATCLALIVMELELIEPSLYLAYCPGSADRLVGALRRRLAARP